MDLSGKVAIVTGGTKGIGEGIADKLAELGAKVVVCARSESETKHHFVKADVCSSPDCKNLIDEAVKKFGRVDILVNNAGVYPYAPLLEMTEEQWDKVININLKGTFMCTKAAAIHMAKQKYGRIVNVASIAGIKGFANLAHYCASKGGVIAFTRAAAIELAPHNIRVNAVAPGAIDTPGTEGGDASQKEMLTKMIPAGRIGKPSDIANVVAFLASDESDYVTGQLVVADGGWTD